MKKLIFSIFCIALAGVVRAQSDLVITEFMYNDASGPDSLEFVEIYNNTFLDITMTGYQLNDAVTFTFPDFMLEGGGFVIVAKDSVAFENNFGMTAFQWDGAQGLNNSGETLELLDAGSNIVDVLTYDDGDTWPGAADGTGPSLVLCDVGADNSGPEAWNVSTTSAGFSIDGIEVFASPGALESCTPPGPTQYPAYSIGEVSTVDADGVADSLGVTVQLQGVVYGENIRPGGLQFTLIDENNDGIHVFSDADDLGYTVVEGDELIIRGSIGQFRGLLQINPDTVIEVSGGNALVDPTVVTDLGEDTESQLIRINGLTVDNPADWTNDPPGFNVVVTDGTNSFEMRIDEDVDIFGTQPPSGTFDLIGLGGQFDQDVPYDEGYQILPRYMEDILDPSGTLDPALAENLQLFPNPVKDVLNLIGDTTFDEILIRDMTGRTVKRIVPDLSRVTVSVADLTPGLYFVTVLEEGGYWTEKITVE